MCAARTNAKNCACANDAGRKSVQAFLSLHKRPHALVRSIRGLFPRRRRVVKSPLRAHGCLAAVRIDLCSLVGMGLRIDGLGVESRRPRLRLGAAREPRDGATLPGSDRPLLGARRRQSGAFHSRRRCRRPLQRATRTGLRRRQWCALRAAQSTQCRTRHEPSRALVQRKSRTLRARDRRRLHCRLRSDLRP